MPAGGLLGWGRWVNSLQLFGGHEVLTPCLGYHMAKNLRAKIPVTDTLVIRDVNEDVMKKFAEETKEIAKSTGTTEGTYKVEVAGGPREVAEKSVSSNI